jgi:hypothetical protein
MKKLLTAAPIAISLASPATAQIEPEPFELHSVVTFSKPTMSCPNVDDAVAADKQGAAWLDARGCKNLNPGVKQWVVVNSGSERLTRSRQLAMSYGCVISKERYDQTKAEWDRRDTYRTGVYFVPWQQQIGKECRYVVRRMLQ